MKRIACCFALVASGMAFTATAEPIHGEITVGRLYDSNVTIDEIDRVSHVGDIATLLEAQAAWKTPLAYGSELRLSYNLTQTWHDDFSAFNQQIQSVIADLSRDFGPVSTGLTWRHTRSRLNGRDFSTGNQFVAAAGRTFGPKFQVRGSYSWTDRSYDGRAQRDAVSQAVAVDGFYYYVRGAANYVSAGLRHNREDAQAAQFSFDGDAIRMRTARRFRWQKQIVTGQLAWQYEDRRYDGVTASIGAPRHDRRSSASARLEAPFGDGFSVAGEFAVSDYDSNLPSADYSQQIASIRVSKDF